jgi:phosphate starvation-inducible membrane PsiE
MTDEEQRTRGLAERGFGLVEDGLYVAVAFALTAAGLILFGYSIYSFIDKLDELSIATSILELLDNLLLVFIITEIIHTIRAVIDEKVLVAEPFLVVGAVAAIRRLIVVSAEAKTLLGTGQFTDAMLEIGILTGTILLLALAIFLLRHTTHSEPRPSHEPG